MNKSREMKRLWKKKRKIMLSGAAKGTRNSHKSKLWLNSVRESRSSKERSKCMKKTWERKRRTMLAGARIGQSLGGKAFWKRKDAKKIVSKALKHKWRTDRAFAEMVVRDNLSQGRLHPSKLQVSAFRILRKRTRLKLELDCPVGPYNLDIAYPRKKLAIEINGSYWHGKKTRRRKVRKRARFLAALGWTVLSVSVKRKSLSEKQFSRCIHFLK